MTFGFAVAIAGGSFLVLDAELALCAAAVWAVAAMMTVDTRSV
jgi:hypothetical protein